MRSGFAAALWLLVVSIAPALASTPVLDGTSGWGGQSGNADLVLTLTTTQTNDAIIVFTPTTPNANSVSSITDTAGLTFHKRSTVFNAGVDVEEWYAFSSGVLTGDAISVHFTGSTTATSGVAFATTSASATVIFDQHLSSPVTTTGPSACSITTANSADLILGLYHFNTANPTAGTGFTAIVSPTGTFALTEYQSVSSPQTNLSVAIGSGSSNVVNGICDAVTDTTVLASENASKANAYVVLNSATKMADSKTNTYIVLTPATAVTGTLFHSFPP